MRKYVILRKSEPARSGRAGARGIEKMGSTRANVSGAPPTFAFERLTDRAAASMAAEPEVQAVVPAMPTRLITPLESEAGGAAPDWGLEATGATTSRYDGAGVKVAILDTGIHAIHAAFKGIKVEQKDFSGDGDGDGQGHGTHCAGTVFGRDVGQRIGVARGVTEAFIGKVLRNDGGGDSEMIFSGMQWAIGEKADIVSMSLGFDFPGMVAEQVKDNWPADLATSNALEAYRGNLRMFDAIMQMARAMGPFGGGALVFAAAGNESQRQQHAQWRIAASLPAAGNDVISVAAVGRDGEALEVAPFSNSMPVVAGPGVDITSAWNDGGLHTISGTSMACPHVAGLAALWWQKVREDGRTPTPLNVRSALIQSARRERFTQPDEADIGQGLVMAP